MTQAISHRAIEPGTTGWTVEDFHDPEIQMLLGDGRFEIVDGVLTKLPPQGFYAIDALTNLRGLLQSYLRATEQEGMFYHEVDVLLRQERIARPDMFFLTPDQRRRQLQLQQERKRPRSRYHPIYVTPTLVVESVSIGTEDHDRITKRRWYAAARIPHYWILTSHEKSLVCLVLKGRRYVEEASATDNGTMDSGIFGGVSISLADVWDE